MNKPINLSAKIEFLIQKELKPKEAILWAGRPHALMFAKRMRPISLFFVFWTMFIIFWLALAGKNLLLGLEAQNKNVIMSGVVVIIFLVIGIMGMLIPLFAYLNAKKTIYILTHQRASVVKDNLPGRVKLTDLAFRRPPPSRVLSRQGKDGYGDIIFERTERYDGNRISIDEKAFYYLQEIQNVERTINSLWK